MPLTLSSTQKLVLVAVTALLALLATALLLSGVLMTPEGGNATGTPSDAEMFMGLQKVPASELHATVPDAKGKPTLLMFTSKFCLECKKLTPVVMKLLPQYPGVHFQKYDILEDRQKYAPVFDRFQPVSVPTLVFVDKQGEIRNVLYNDQPAKEISTSLETVSNTQ